MKRISLRASRTHCSRISRIVTSLRRRLRLEPLEARSLLSGTPHGEISGTKWNDWNANGAHTLGEPGLAGWTIYLDTDLDGQFDPTEKSTITDVHGNYHFTGLEPGNYRVTEVPQAGWQATNPAIGYRDVTVGSARQRLFVLRETSPLSTIVEYDPDTGAVLNSFPTPATIDPQYQGLAMGPNSLFFIDGAGPGPHWFYELNLDTGAVIDADVLDTAATSRITGLAYQDGLRVLQDEIDRIASWNFVNDTFGNGFLIPGLLPGPMTGAQDLGLLFTADSTGTIHARWGYYVAYEADPFNPGLGALDGIGYANKELLVSRDAEPGVIYRLNPVTGDVLDTLAIGGTEGIADMAGDGIYFDVATQGSPIVSGIDFFSYQPAVAFYGEINGTKYHDKNANGKQDANEPGLPGWTISINGLLGANTVTDAAGNYKFTGLPPGKYTVKETLQGGWAPVNPVSGTQSVTIGNGVVVQRLFALRQTSPVSTIEEYDPVTGSVINSFPAPVTVDPQYQGLAMGPNSLFFIDGAGNGPHMLYELDPNTGAMLDSDIVDANSPTSRVTGVAYHEGRVYFVQDQSDQVIGWNPVTDASAGIFAASGLEAGTMAGAGDYKLLFTADSLGKIFARDGLSPGVVKYSIEPGLGPLAGLAYINKELLVSRMAEPGTLYRVNLTTGQVLGTVAIGGSVAISDLAGDGALPVTTSDLIVNGGFETGDFTGWTISSAVGSPQPWTVSTNGSSGTMAPLSSPYGTYSAWNGFDGAGPTKFVMYQDVSIPAGANTVLQFGYRARLDTTGQPRLLKFAVRDPDSNGVVIGVGPPPQHSLVGQVDLDQWNGVTRDLTSLFYGETVRIYFEESIPLGSTGPGQFEIDNITAIATSLPPVVNKVDFGSILKTLPSGITPQLFYNNSAYDLNVGVDANDDLAIATDKAPYSPGMGPMTAPTTNGFNSFVHLSNYSRGINGLLIDLPGLHPSITVSDFTFKVGQNNTPSLWANARTPNSVTVRTTGLGLAPGNARVEIIWPNNSIRNTWLEVRVKANANTGLSDAAQAPDGDGIGAIFYFGNRVANSGHGDTVSFVTNATDEIQARNHPGSALPLTNRFDYNKDKLVAATDQILARNNPGILPFINIPNPPAAPAASALAVNDDDAVALALASTRAATEEQSPKTLHSQRTALEQREPQLNRAAVAQCFERWTDTLELPRLKKVAAKGDTSGDAAKGADFDWGTALGKL